MQLIELMDQLILSSEQAAYEDSIVRWRNQIDKFSKRLVKINDEIESK